MRSLFANFKSNLCGILYVSLLEDAVTNSLIAKLRESLRRCPAHRMLIFAAARGFATPDVKVSSSLCDPSSMLLEHIVEEFPNNKQ